MLIRSPRTAAALALCALTVTLASTTDAHAQTKRRRVRAPLASRGESYRALPALDAAPNGQNVQSAPAPGELVMGRVGVIRVPRVSLRDQSGKLLAVTTEGTSLAVLGESNGYYGVLMQDSTLGWLPTGAVNLLEYRVQVRLARRAAPQESSATPGTQLAQTMRQSVTQSSASSALPDVQTADPRTASLLREAFTYLGVPYVWAGNTRSGLDCSAFVRSVFARSRGIALPRTSGEQARCGSAVASTGDLLPGDRLYFDMGRKGRISHTGIYVGGGYFIHASSNQHQVAFSKLASGNYWRSLVAARRDL